jgi:glyoxylase-like metal-dependent hydrolase (beta-lactamase superfamily II)
MTLQITTITLPFPLKFSSVNCYLIKTDAGFYLVDTGMSNNRQQLEAELEHLGCQPGDLNLILITHGDFDHTGNAVYLRKKFGSQICMHAEDMGMLENGDMFYHRKFDNRIIRGLMRAFLPLKKENRGHPDFYLEDEASLLAHGLDATVYCTPGHSSGSICILTCTGELFCGDLFTSARGKGELNSMMYDKEAGAASLERLKSRSINRVYPGHGKPFPWEELS